MASSEHPDEAKEFIAFLATEGQRIRYEDSGDIPLDLAIAEEVDWAGGVPGREDGLEVLSHARSLLFVPNRWDVIAPFYDAWGLVLDGRRVRPGGPGRRRSRHPREPRQGVGGLGGVGPVGPRDQRSVAPLREAADASDGERRRRRR